MDPNSATGDWWCPLCAAEAEPCFIGDGADIAYHRFGEPPFVARHALVRAGDRAVLMPAEG